MLAVLAKIRVELIGGKEWLVLKVVTNGLLYTLCWENKEEIRLPEIHNGAVLSLYDV